MQFERLKRVEAREPIERIRRSPDAPDGLFGVVDKSGLIIADAAQDAAARFEAVAARRQDEHDKAKVNEAVSRYLKQDQTIRYDPKEGLMYTPGDKANGLYDRSLDIYSKLSSDMSGELENENQRRMFKEAVTPFERSATLSLCKHEAEEVRAWNEQQDKERRMNEGTAYAQNFDTPEGQAAALQSSVTDAKNKFGELPEGEEAAKNPHVREIMAEKTGYALNVLVQNDPVRAEKLLDMNKDLFDGVTFAKLKGEVDKAALPVKAQGLAENLLKKYGVDGQDKALDEVRKNYQGKEEDTYIGYVNNLFTDAKQEQVAQQNKTANQIFDGIMSHSGYGKVSSALTANKELLGPKLYWSLKEDLDQEYQVGKYAPKPRATGGGTGDDLADLFTWSQAKDDLAAGKFSSPKEFFKAYAGKLKFSTLRGLANTAFYGKDDGEDGEDGSGVSSGGRSKKDPYNNFNPMKYIKDQVTAAGIEDTPQQSKAFWLSYSDEVHSQEKQLKRKLTSEELQTVADKELSKEIVRKEYNVGEKVIRWFGYGKSFKPDETTEAHKYLIDYAMKHQGVKYNADTDTYYTIDDKGNVKGWLPDDNPKPKSNKKK